MDEYTLREDLLKGEDSTRQFKRHYNNAEEVSQDLVALLNAKGGRIYIGVDNDGSIHGLRAKAIDSQGQLIANAATDHVTPPAGVFTENVMTSEGPVIVVSVEEGADKPYQSSDGFFYVKRAEGNRKVTNRSELQRMFQAARTIYAEARVVDGSTLADLDRELFAHFYRVKYNVELTSART